MEENISNIFEKYQDLQSSADQKNQNIKEL